MNIKELKDLLNTLPEEMEVVLVDCKRGISSLHKDKIEIKDIIMHSQAGRDSGEHRLLSDFTKEGDIIFFSERCLILS